MKNTFIVLLVTFVSLPTLTFNTIAFNKNEKDSCITVLNKTDLKELSIEERNGLIRMRVEEKLARDAYITLGEIWSVRIFQNIQKSEQRHMDAMKRLIDIYEIPDPAENDAVGIFSLIEFQKLYDELVQKGTASYNDAMLVGREIEELDISDLENQLLIVDNPDIKIVYENLKAASERHLKAFNRHIKKN
ncbi:MAG: DUF2202 domain-containing protein [Ignavibacteria bacterium]|nr:DUF2202 domain-containing protein [Ignavibacteria bacterium]MBT8382304.1 DUF2202 domain-containing protein [Ignavibacteria bacterium]MBT8391932.1 DUF2202 domain-containing protein [Ignavibacteria bacterium]NNJ52205.1 DUF2202 domain-containing protein [Ignavibacteriaceae bacterium]NNL21752.1 DUF2202 domain-containing protein [Ignavibacteriaceae bacterium]